MSEIIRSNVLCFIFSKASSVEVDNTTLMPNASNACRSKRLLLGLSSTHMIVALDARRTMLVVTSSFANAAAARAFLAAFSGVDSAREPAAAPSAAATSVCVRLSEASNRHPLMRTLPNLRRNLATMDRIVTKRTRPPLARRALHRIW